MGQLWKSFCLGTLKFGLNQCSTTIPLSYFKCKTHLVSHQGYKKLQKQGPTKADWSREPETYSLTFSTFLCEMGSLKPVCKYISFELDKNLRCFSLRLTQHGFQHRILSVNFILFYWYEDSKLSMQFTFTFCRKFKS